MSADGGTARRLTYHSASEIPSAFTPDGKFVLFSASIQDPAQSALFPTGAMTELYKVPVTGGRTEQVLATPAEWVCFDKSGKNFLYQDRKGFEDEWRKHHTSSITRDVWLYDASTGKHTNLTNREGEDRNPVYAPDGNSVYFLSERNGGSFNVYNFALNTPQEVKAITTFRTHPVRFLSISDKGTLCYTYDGELYTQEPNARPKKVNVDLVRDDEKEIATLRFSQGATSASVSPDGDKSQFLTIRRVLRVSTFYGFRGEQYFLFNKSGVREIRLFFTSYLSGIKLPVAGPLAGINQCTVVGSKRYTGFLCRSICYLLGRSIIG